MRPIFEPNPDPLLVTGEGNKEMQKAVLKFLLEEWPAPHTKLTLYRVGLGDLYEIEEAIYWLFHYGLIWRREGRAVGATAAARQFNWLERS